MLVQHLCLSVLLRIAGDAKTLPSVTVHVPAAFFAGIVVTSPFPHPVPEALERRDRAVGDFAEDELSLQDAHLLLPAALLLPLPSLLARLEPTVMVILAEGFISPYRFGAFFAVRVGHPVMSPAEPVSADVQAFLAPFPDALPFPTPLMVAPWVYGIHLPFLLA